MGVIYFKRIKLFSVPKAKKEKKKKIKKKKMKEKKTKAAAFPIVPFFSK